MKWYVALCFVILMACSQKENSVFIIYSDGNNIQPGDPIQIKGDQVGDIKSVTLDSNYRVIVEARFIGDLPSKDSQFYIDSKNIMGDRVLRCEPGHSNVKIKIGDTVTGRVDSRATSEVEAINRVLQALELLLTQDENDSLIHSIHSLKHRVDSLEKIRDSIDNHQQANSGS